MKRIVLVTGAAGYIGSHTTLCLLEAGFDVVALDNLCNSSHESLRRVHQICGQEPYFIKGDIRDRKLLNKVFSQYNISAVLHFAGSKAVGESVTQPLHYYENNVAGSINLLQAMAEAGLFTMVFSSSATVYGEPKQIPIREDAPTGTPLNPYGQSKLMVEQVLRDLSFSEPRWSIALLRYFNPIGAHESGLIGESPKGPPDNLLPYISQVAIGKLPLLTVYGNDYSTVDGTGVRDYIHVVDLARGHLKALEALLTRSGINIWNLGTGKGCSVLQIIKAFEQVSGKHVPYSLAPRRTGDIAECCADPSKALKELGWQAEYELERMMIDTWRWQSQNPDGYS